MNTIEQYGDAKTIRAFITRNFADLEYGFTDDVMTYIKKYAFAGVTDLKTLSLPSITEIPSACFMKAEVADTFDLPWDKITAIGVGAFAYSNAIKDSTLNLPEVTDIGNAAFYQASGFTSLIADKWDTTGFDLYAVNIPSGGIFEGSSIQSISAPLMKDDVYFGPSTFKDCTSLASVDLPLFDGGTENMFYGCTALTEIELPALSAIKGDYMMYRCTSLQKMTMPEVTAISGSYAFNGCTALKEVSLPKLTEITGSSAFNACSTMTSISLPLVTEIGNSCFYGCSKMTSYDLPKLESTGSNAFYNNSSLTSVSFPKLETVGNSCFNYCRYLVTVNLPSAKTMGSSVFTNDSRLKTVTLGGDISAFPSLCFSRCSNLVALVLPGLTSVPTKASNTFNYATKINNGTGIIYVPDSLVDSFKADSSWSSYTIQGTSTYTG